MNKIFSSEKLWLILLILLVVPFFVLSFFVHPSADDFILSAVVRDEGIIAHFKQVYFEWSGRYFGTLIVSLNPLVFGWDFGYKLIPIALLLIFYAGIYSLIKNIFKEEISAIRKQLISLIIFVVFVNNIPSTSECIYWMTGSLTYFLASSFTLFLFALYVKTKKSDNVKISELLLMTVFSVMIAGSNEVSMVFQLELSTLIIFYYIINKKSICKAHLINWIVIIIATVVVVSAPGNYSRMDTFSGHFNIIYSISESFISFTKVSIVFIKDPAFIIITMIFIAFLPYFRKFTFFNNLIKISPFYVIPISILVVTSLFFTIVYSTGLSPALRIHNSVAMIFVFVWFYNVSVLHNYIISKNKNVMIEVPSYLIKLLSLATFILITTSFTKEPGKDIICDGNIFHASYDLVINASSYNTQMNNREIIIKEAQKQNKKTVVLPPLNNVPTIIHFVDITDNPKYWVNESLAKYYNLDSIYLKK